jgi:hypothetical protein
VINDSIQRHTDKSIQARLKSPRPLRGGEDMPRETAEVVAVDVSKDLADYAVFAPPRHDDDLFRKLTVGEWG